MKISFKKNFTSLTSLELDALFKEDFVTIVAIPNQETSNPDCEFDSSDIFVVPNTAVKRFNRETDREHCNIFPPSYYSDVILTSKEYGKKIWEKYSEYNSEEKYKDVHKVLNTSLIFKVLSPAMLEKLDNIIMREFNSLKDSHNKIMDIQMM